MKSYVLMFVTLVIFGFLVAGISAVSERNQERIDGLKRRSEAYDSLLNENLRLKEALLVTGNLKIHFVMKQKRGTEWFWYARIGDGDPVGNIFSSNLDFDADSLYWVIRQTEPRFQDFIVSRFFPESRMRPNQVSNRPNDINYGALQYNAVVLKEFGFTREQAQTWYWLPFINNAYYKRYFESMSDSTYWTAKYTGRSWAWR
jgi:hypothetical protein